MSRLQKLIDELCPNGVEYKRVDEICNKVFAGGTPKTSNDSYYGGNIPWLRSGEINFNSIYDAEIKITEDGLNNSSAKIIKEKSVLIAMTGATVARSAVNEIELTANQSVCAMEVSDKINYKYLYYNIANMYNEIKGMAQGALTSINLNIIKSISIPVPPLEVQREIVHILDDFTLLSAELSAELKARQKQYEYYKSSLFKKYTNNMVELESIGDVTKLAGFEFTKYVNYTNEGKIIALRGLNIKDGRLVLNDVKYIDTSDFSKLDRSKLFINDILYTYVGTVGQVGLIDKNDRYYLAPNVARIRIFDKNVIPKYVMYFLQTPEFKMNQLDKLSGSSSMKNITMSNIRKFKIPIPSKEEQQNIVNILDNFDKLNNDIIEGLPAEIELRQRQYEYYRDRLLTFKELK